MSLFPLLRYAITLFVTCWAVAAGANEALATAPPVSTAQREFVTQALQAIRREDTSTLEAAETTLVNQGATLLPAMQEALAHAQGGQRDVLDNACVRLTWKINPRELVVQWVATMTHQDAATLRQQNRPLPISEEILTGLFPKYRFYTLHYRMYPVARLTPAPLKEQNLFAVSKTGQITHLTTPQALKTFFSTSLSVAAPGNPLALKDTAYAWLRLSQEFSWDGFFQFTIPKETLSATQKGQGWEVGGEALVTPQGGDRGQIEAVLTFDLQGHLTQVNERRNVQAGARPICQATKLLDPDPIVRGMAEQALLVMGISARAYLVERRALAAPPLQQAIDRIWQRIVARERSLGGSVPQVDLTPDR